MNDESNPARASDASMQEFSQSRTARNIKSAEATLASGGQSLAQSDASLKYSRASAAANASTDAREPSKRVCAAVAKEMADVNFEPSIEQAAAGLMTEGGTGG